MGISEFVRTFIVEEIDGLERGRLNSKRRQNILREKNIARILTEFEGLTQAQKSADYSSISSK